MKFYNYDRGLAIKNNCFASLNAYDFIKTILIYIFIIIMIPIIFLIIELVTHVLSFAFLSFITFLGLGIFLPIIYTIQRNKKLVWLNKAFAKEGDKVYLIEQEFDIDHINEKQEFEKIYKNVVPGNISELKQLKLLKETDSYYICNYIDENNNTRELRIAKAYYDLKEVFK